MILNILKQRMRWQGWGLNSEQVAALKLNQ